MQCAAKEAAGKQRGLREWSRASLPSQGSQGCCCFSLLACKHQTAEDEDGLEAEILLSLWVGLIHAK